MSKLSLVDSLKSLADNKSLFRTFFSHGSLDIEIYKPDGVDLQKPHDRDEIYVVASGSSHFSIGAEEYDAIAGDILFVAEGVQHRFSNFSDDFATGVFFYGPKGGEGP